MQNTSNSNKNMKKVNTDKLRQIILALPEQFPAGIKAAEKIKSGGNFEKILVCGMGGSAQPADILDIFLKYAKISIPLFVHRDYGLPAIADKKTLVICISYSGNTEETVSAYKEARRKNLKIAAISSGGLLAKLCKQDNVPIAIVPSVFPPRCALGYQFSALLKILVNCGIIKTNLNNLASLEKELKPAALEGEGKKIAGMVKNRIPVVYASRSFRSLAKIWKIKFNEHAKTAAFFNYFPEVNHNEMTGFTKPRGKFLIIIMRDKNDHPMIQKRMKITADLFRKMCTPVYFIDIKGKNIFSKIFNTNTLGEWSAFYLAKEYNMDPIQIKMQEEFKKRL